MIPATKLACVPLFHQLHNVQCCSDSHLAHFCAVIHARNLAPRIMIRITHDTCVPHTPWPRPVSRETHGPNASRGQSLSGSVKIIHSRCQAYTPQLSAPGPRPAPVAAHPDQPLGRPESAHPLRSSLLTDVTERHELAWHTRSYHAGQRCEAAPGLRPPEHSRGCARPHPGARL